MKSVFDPGYQQNDVDSKIVASLERLSSVFRVMLWQENRRHGLSPIQVQILVFLLFHDRPLTTVSRLSREFNVTAPTISDAVRVLESKSLVESVGNRQDRRVANLLLTPRGKIIAREASLFANDMRQEVEKLATADKAIVLNALLQTIAGLQARGIISSTRMCLSCRNYERRAGSGYCRLMDKPLAPADLRVDCPDHIRKVG